MKKIALLFCILLSLQAFADDREKIKATALDYAMGWYTGDGDRMARALHPDLAKRIATAEGLQHMTAEQLIAGTRKGWGKSTPEDQRLADVTIFDVFGNAATVRLEMRDWIDYLHVAKFGDEWKIVNVLWEKKPKPPSTGG